METKEIQQQEWQQFFDNFSRKHGEGKLVLKASERDRCPDSREWNGARRNHRPG